MVLRKYHAPNAWRSALSRSICYIAWKPNRKELVDINLVHSQEAETSNTILEKVTH